MTADPFTEAARIIDAHRENDRWVGGGVKIECVCGHVSHATGAVTHYPITEDKNNHRDAERMHAAHVAQVLAAQEPTDAEKDAAMDALGCELRVVENGQSTCELHGGYASSDDVCEVVDVALSAAGVARRGEEPR